MLNAINQRWGWPMSRLAAAAALLLAAHTATAATATTAAQAAKTCVPTSSIEYDGDPDPGDTCAVVTLRPIRHTRPQLFYQQQIFLTPDQAKAHPDLRAALNDPDGNDGAGMAVLQAMPGGRLSLVVGVSGQDAYFDPPPHIEATPQGPILLIPASATVTSAPDLSVAMRRIGGRWVRIVDDWSDIVLSRVPKDVAQWKGGLMDWRHLIASSALWHKNDADCCPAGGSYEARLKLVGAQLVLVSLHISKQPLPD